MAQITVYEFSELPLSVREKLIETYRSVNTESLSWWEPDKEKFEMKLSSLGYRGVTSCFSVGDRYQGAAFKGSIAIYDFLLREKLTGKYRKLYTYCRDSSRTINAIIHHPYHYTCRTANMEIFVSDAILLASMKESRLLDKQVEAVVYGLIEDEARKLAREYFGTLLTTLSYEESDPVVEEYLTSSGWLFTKKGVRVDD